MKESLQCKTIGRELAKCVKMTDYRIRKIAYELRKIYSGV